ncbi:MAG: copper chaperone PCu(A)C [Jannaschia sp.]
MRNILAATALAAFAAAALTSPLWAEDKMIVLGDLHIMQPMLRATVPNAPVGSGFVTIANMGETVDTLVAASIDGDLAGRVELHEMKMAEGVMSMSEVDGGITIPAGGEVSLAPGGLHLMIMGLAQPLTAGETYSVTLTFETAGAITLDFPVMTLGEIRASVEETGQMNHGSGHGAGHAGHGN